MLTQKICWEIEQNIDYEYSMCSTASGADMVTNSEIFALHGL